MSDKSFLGTGWSFPPAFDSNSASVKMISDEEDVHSSIEILLKTKLGERVMQPRYGCNLDDMVFAPMSTTFKTYIKELVKNAIVFNEPRVELISIDLDSSRDLEGILLLNIEYEIRATNSRFNFVFPYYKNEGTEIKQ